jgi:hypothetical protein
MLATSLSLKMDEPKTGELKKSDWLNGLVKSLSTVISNTFVKAGIPKDKADARTKALTNTKFIPVWIRAFTHETYSDDNYETLEYIGDAFLKLAFPRYLMTKFPNLDQQGLTSLNNAYMSKSKMFQADIANRYKLNTLVRMVENAEVRVKISTDIFESFFGAIFDIGENITLGLGYSYGYSILQGMLTDEKINIKYAAGDAKTTVDQIFSRFNIQGEALPGPVPEFKQLTRNLISFKLTLPQETVQFIRTQTNGAIDIKDPVLANVESKTKKGVENAGYEAAVNKLANYGLNKDAARILKHRSEFSLNPTLRPLREPLMKKLVPLGFVEWYFHTPQKLRGTSTTTIQFKARNKDGTTKILKSITVDNDKQQNAREQLVKDYLAA